MDTYKREKTEKQKIAGTIHVKEHEPKSVLDLNPPFEPKVNNRFIVYMEKIPTFIIHKVIRPVISNDGGKYKYDDLILELWDPIDLTHPGLKSASTILTEIQRENKTIFDEITLSILGPIGDEVERWLYKNCTLQTITYSTLDWANGQPITITLRFSFEEAIHEF